MSRLTKVQQDVIDRLSDGWRLEWTGVGYCVRKHGEPTRHVREQTAVSLIGRNLVKLVGYGRWTVA